MFKFFSSKKHPRGPDWSTAREHCLDFSGTKFYFRVPEHTDPIISFKPKPEKYNIYDESIFWKDTELNNPASFLEGGFSIDWQFKGSPLSGRVGRLKFSIAITRNTSLGSLYRPDNFIASINQQLNYSLGPLSALSNLYNCRIIRKNWSIRSIGQIPYAYYEEHESNSLSSSSYWKTPISDEHYLTFAFHKHIYEPDTTLHQAYNELIEKILSSVRIEWSAEALKQQAIAKEKWPDEKLPEHLPELEWPDEEWQAHESDEKKAHREFLKEIEEHNAKYGKLEA
ncbi:hypothetical protein MNBD_GAMMA11-1018 [hydrothermal vent metagenome]|uniref:Uncharacterized protein n=1 Tax=hydrothermal vent metagenome TaxID=652676 RepID=A0A3B0X696_9ZZZZ